MKWNLLSLLLISVFVTGCGAFGPIPQNAQEYRATFNKKSGASAITYTVNRPYYKVVKTIKKKVKECLGNKVVGRSMCGGPYGAGCSSQKMTYTATVKQGKTKSELHVQMEMTKTLHLGGKPPKGGTYIAVIDILKVGRNKTKIKEYAPRERKYFSKIPNAVKHWANKTNMGCPDFTTGSVLL